MRLEGDPPISRSVFSRRNFACRHPFPPRRTTAGDFLNWNPHIHGLVSSGTFHADGSFVPAAVFQENILRELFEAHVYKLLVSRELIGPDLIAKMRTWRHSGFQAYVGPSILQKEDAVRAGLYYCSRSGFRIQTPAYRRWPVEIPGQRICTERSA